MTETRGKAITSAQCTTAFDLMPGEPEVRVKAIAEHLDTDEKRVYKALKKGNGKQWFERIFPDMPARAAGGGVRKDLAVDKVLSALNATKSHKDAAALLGVGTGVLIRNIEMHKIISTWHQTGDAAEDAKTDTVEPASQEAQTEATAVVA